MAYLIPLIVIAASLTGISYLFIRHARNFSKGEGSGLVYPDFHSDTTVKEPIAHGKASWSFLELLHVGEREAVFLFMEKFFRKLRVRLMKIENWLTSVTNHLHEKTARRRGEKQPPASFISLRNENTEFDETYWINVLKQNQESPYPYKKLGEIYAARGDFHEARSLFRCALKLDPRDSQAQAKIVELKGKKTKRANGTSSLSMPA